MLTPNDLKQIGMLIDEKLKQQDIRSGEKIDQVKQDLSQKIDQTREQTIKDVADHFADSVLPLLEKHDSQIEDLQHHVTHPPGAPATV